MSFRYRDTDPPKCNLAIEDSPEINRVAVDDTLKGEGAQRSGSERRKEGKSGRESDFDLGEIYRGLVTSCPDKLRTVYVCVWRAFSTGRTRRIIYRPRRIMYR